MSPVVERYLLRLQRRAATLQPDLARAVLRAWEALRARLTIGELEQLIRTASPERLVSAMLSAQETAGALLPLHRAAREAVQRAAGAAQHELPRGVTVQFDVLNPRVLDAVRLFERQTVSGVLETAQATVRQHVAAGLQAGVGPRTMARGIRDVLGLAPNQEAAVRNFRRALEGAENAGSPLTRQLRDRRFDAMVARGDLSPEQMDRLTEAYRKRMVAFHAETVSRTASLDAMKLGQRLTWQAAVERGDVDGNRLMKTWHGVLDDRERPEHVAMEGETVLWSDPYSNGQQQPGDDEWNCRCVSLYRQVADPLKALRPGAGEQAA